MQLVLTSDRHVDLHETINLEAELRSRLGDEYGYVSLRGLPAPGKDFTFKLEGNTAGSLTLCLNGTASDIAQAIGRWCTCCSTVKTGERVEYDTGEDQWAADDPATGRSIVQERWYQSTHQSVDRHLKGTHRITLGTKTPIIFSLGHYTMG